MPHRTFNRFQVLLTLAACLALGCSKGGSLGCGGGDSGGGDSVETALEGSSKLIGLYKVDSYQQSEGTCDQLADIADRPSYLVLYHFQPNDGSATRLGGAFCEDPNRCRAFAKRATEPPIGYSFLSGDDASGWRGWAILETGSLEDKCAATVQSHTLSTSALGAIRVETKTVEVFFLPTSEEDGVATCSNTQAIAVATKEEGCKALLNLEATREADL